MEGNFIQRLFSSLDQLFSSMEAWVTPSPALDSFLSRLDSWVWGNFLVFLLVATGLYFALRNRFIQLRKLRHAIDLVRGKYDNPDDEGDISHFQALATALSATIGTGNIAGVATAIAAGGPGAVFWMWVTGFLGSGIKFASCTLGMRFRIVHEDGSASGGPMYYLEHGLGRRWFSSLSTLAALVGAFLLSWQVGSESMSAPLRALLQLMAFSGLLLIWFIALRLLRSWSAPLAPRFDPLLRALHFQKWLAVLFALFAAIASFGIGNMIQANSLALPLYEDLGVPKSLTGIILALLAGLVIIGGIKRIGRFTGKLTPAMTIIYVIGAMAILIKNASAIPGAFELIFYHAFHPTAAAGGFAGAAVSLAIQKGVARGVFSNESGLGSAPIAHAAAKTREPVREGLVAMIGPFVDTLLICTMTALVILTTGAWTLTDPGTGLGLTSTILSKTAFEMGLPGFGGWIVTSGILLFVFSTIIGWSYYGDRSVEYLFGSKGIRVYRWIYILLIPLGAAMKVEVMWTIADITNGLMAFPNLVGLIFLSPLVLEMTREYFSREQKRTG
ncbi:MAG: sodium:alanine symporter family protein [Candidatus Krumholzibacteria bacterium]|nr:sodium:alanine symporter family protein [Candidatus Krumholzibacteria bacterium]MDP6668408.1 sodium:alanine symporter family protein [Candidatus Krumholzibacteria bacterium]MDP6797977.1 sodium:alanine symporter family protein [Candidatus Krumholzibacteria bacterium]MDP7021868.1 sodium:alanine symporter family protein [Candidatus Krumholzibacteria bacterium]